VQVKYAGGGTAEQAAKRDVPKIAAEYFGVWDPLPGGPPAYGMYARNVKGLTLQNVRLEYEEADMRPALIFDNVQDASVNGLSIQGNPQTEAVRLINCKDLLFSATRVLTSASSFLSVEGAESEGITVNGGDIRKASKQVVYRDGGSEKAIKISV
jgi:hypothetical protein